MLSIFTMILNRARLLLRLPNRVIVRCNRTTKCIGIYRHPTPSLISICCRYFSEKNENLFGELCDDDFECEEASYTDVDLDSIAEGNENTLRLLKLFQLEIDYIAHRSGHVPSKITESNLRELLLLPTKTKRANYIKRLWKNELRKRATKCIKAEKQRMFEESRKNNPIKRIKLETNSPIKYGLGHNSLFFRFRPDTVKNVGNFKLLQAMMFGPDIIVDCGYENYMNSKELSSFTYQLMMMWALNRDNLNPFNIIFCNLSTDSLTYKKMCILFPSIEEDPAFPFNHTDKTYLDLYPREQLVYLTPNSGNTLEKYDGSKVYILGGLVDRGREQPMSLAKAKRDGIPTAKLPIDKYIQWTTGDKSLRLPQCIAVVNDVKDGKNWPTAFRHIISQRIENSETSLPYNVDEERKPPSLSMRVDQRPPTKFTYMLLKNNTGKE